MEAEKTVHLENEVSEVSVIYITPLNTLLYIGYNDGKLEQRVPTTMQVEKTLKFESAIKAIISNENKVYVSLANGRIVYF